MSKTQKLTDQEDLFVKAYCGPAHYKTKQAVEMAGIESKNPSKYGYRLLQRDHVRAAIDEFKQRKANDFWLKEEDILRGLYAEATDRGEGSSHSARIAAWVHLGKHIGMFSEKKEEAKDATVTYNIINYGNTADTAQIRQEATAALENMTEKERERACKDADDIIEGVVITDYSETEIEA